MRHHDLRQITQSLFESLDRRPPLPTGDVMHACADLQERANDRQLVANRFEVELLEQIARLEPVAGFEMGQRLPEARVVAQWREHGRL